MTESSPSELDWAIRTEIYGSFGRIGASPSAADLSDRFDVTPEGITASLERLHAAHEIAPTLDGREVWMANPFSAVETAYPVETPHMSCWSNCAWDALGVAAILGVDGWTRTNCAESGSPLEFGVRDGERAGDDGVIHLVTPLRHAWDNIGFT